MAQLIATNQLTLTNVNDGQTPYVHWAYSDNADGTGLTLTDNGQRYIGNYSDYTQADSMDKTKYRWTDRWAKIEVDGRNLAQKTSSDWSTPYTSFSGSANTCPPLYKVLIDDLKVGDTLKTRIVLKYTNIVPASGQTARIWLHGDGNVTSWYAGCYTSSPAKTISGSGEMVFEHEFKITADHLKNQFWNLMFRTDYIASGSLQWKLAKVEKGTVFTGWSPDPKDVENKLNTKADQDKVVYKTDISVTDEGIVHSASKTVNGQTIASMIAQRAEWVEIIAKLLKVKGDMIVDGTIGANKLSVSTLSALAADLGQISGGSLELLKSEAQGTSSDSWGSFTIPTHKSGLYIDNIGAISSGTPVRKSSSESVASDMPVAVLTSGQLRFARVNQSNDLGNVLHYGLSDPDNATISFDVASDGTKQLLIQANGQIVNQATNYTGWNSTGVAGVYYKQQGDVVALKMQVNTTANKTYGLGKIPVSLLPIQNAGTMMRVPAWTADQSIGRNLQINSDGSMALLASNRGDTFNTQVTWII